jgi:hypothetical protein
MIQAGQIENIRLAPTHRYRLADQALMAKHDEKDGRWFWHWQWKRWFGAMIGQRRLSIANHRAVLPILFPVDQGRPSLRAAECS